MISPEPEELGVVIPDEKHDRIVIHLDIDCFYAQVEMLKNPSLRDKPVGVQQRTLVVTSNYEARKQGVGKCMNVEQALAVCPALILVNGEDVAPYREYAAKITNLLREYSDKVEKLGFDENFVDVTEYLQETCVKEVSEVPGFIYGDAKLEDMPVCQCGCHQKLIEGAFLAKTIRNRILSEIGLTTCAGISWNKLLSKLVGPTHKPNNQTVIFPDQVESLMASILEVRSVAGIGRSTADKLHACGVRSIPELQTCSLDELEKLFDKPTAIRLLKLSFGVDDTPVKVYEKSKTIGVEDAFEPVTVFPQCKPRLQKVLERVVKLIIEDGRMPTTMKVTVRLRDKAGRTVREARQTTLSTAIFRGNIMNITSNEVQSALVSKCLELVKKIVGNEKKLFITLFGISFGKLLEKGGPSVLSTFFSQKGASSSSKTCIRSFSVSQLEPAGSSPTSSCPSGSQQAEPSEEKLSAKYDTGNKSFSEEEYVHLDDSVLSELPLEIKNEVLSSYRSPSSIKRSNSSLSPVEADWNPEVFDALPEDIKNELRMNAQRGNSPVLKPVKKQRTILDFIGKK